MRIYGMFDYLVRRFFNLITLACAGIYAFFVLKSAYIKLGSFAELLALSNPSSTLGWFVYLFVSMCRLGGILLPTGVLLAVGAFLVVLAIDSAEKFSFSECKQWLKKFRFTAIGTITFLCSLNMALVYASAFYFGKEFIAVHMQLLAFNPAYMNLRPWTVLSSLFMHSGVMHFMLNMCTLSFLDDLERHIGPVKTMVAFLVIGALTNVARAAIYSLPLFAGSVFFSGASCAIAGLMTLQCVLLGKSPFSFRSHLGKRSDYDPNTPYDQFLKSSFCGLLEVIGLDLCLMLLSALTGALHSISHLGHAIGGAVAVLWLNAERFLPLFPRMFLPETQLSTADQKRMGKNLTSEQLQQPCANVDPDAKSATDSSWFGQRFHFFASKEHATGLVPGKA
ncbi:MAG: hypothetical protein CMF52_07445 [Legionellales bacterium]|nr:hypothetical protein [Legionellales bacterium]